ncbi:MAG: ATP-dependent zinc metalloprotease FtsH [Planctomycetota bacterium]
MESRKASRDKLGRPNWQGWAVPLLLVLVSLAALHTMLLNSSTVNIEYSKFKRLLAEDKVKSVKIGPTEIVGEANQEVKDDSGRQSRRFRTARVGLENDASLYALLEDRKINYTGEEEPSAFTLALLWLLPVLLVMGFLYFFMFRRLGAGGSAMTFGRSKAKLYAQEDLNISFDDVAGIDEAVEELREVVDFLKTPQKYQAIGGRIPKGVLLVGPPGTGKTLLAKAVAGEADVAFFGLSGSDFVEMFVGVGAARVRDLFAQGEQRAPCIIFIDELDALGKTRGSGMVGGHDEREQTLNQLLVEMDGFDSNRGVIIMAATNRPETLDPALLRPGRFDRTVVVDRPDVNGREAILKVHVRNVKVAEDLDLRSIAALTPGFVGADLANLVNEAALLAARKGKPHVGKMDLEEAIERGVAGLERKQRVMMPEEKQRIAYHECGHAIVAYMLPGADPVHKISIIPRGIGALGYTLQRPLDDRYLATQSELENRICTLLGGIAAEELVFPEVSTGAQNDLERVSQIARSMVREFGMSPKLGRINYNNRERSQFLGGMGALTGSDYSEATACDIDQEVRRIVDAAATLAKEILVENRSALERLAQLLLEKEVLDADQLKEVMDATSPRLVHGTMKAVTHPASGAGTTPAATPEAEKPPLGWVEPSP